ncbi:PBSX family phage terminase large subunit [Terribacillus saccharophilus]|uniref:PBSX family phage terminase large subunit n=1 Tax=Terribacillus saccharophilus TaxID=361277 RepID=UPI0015960A3F|nr:PBSX family phage terminase large subunit [Terribacillus saccharophilus]
MPAINLNVDKTVFNRAYLPYLNTRTRYNIFYGGAGSGKSRFLAMKLTLDLLKRPKTKLLVVRQTFASIRDSVYAEFLDVFDMFQITDHLIISKSTLNIEFPNGSTIIFKGGDDETKLLSISGVDLCWVEEAFQISYDLWSQLKLRLRGGGQKKQFFLSFNPISALHWLKKEFFDNPLDDVTICHTTYKDNRFLDDEYIRSIEEMETRDPVKYAVYALGKWGVMGRKVFENWAVESFKVSELMKENNAMEMAVGMDFGYVSDPSTLICSLVDVANRKLYIFDELYEHGLLNNELARRVIDMGYAKERIVADSAERKSIDELRGYGLRKIQPAAKGAGSILTGIQYVQQFDIIVHPDCEHTINELENYSYKKDKQTGKYTNQPSDNFNHLIDALRYSLEPFRTNNRLTTLPSNLFGI